MELLQVHYVDLGVPRLSDLKGDLSVGRTEGNDIVLNHPSVSRKHAKFEVLGDQWWIVDLKSTNGVKVNGNLVAESPIDAGDKISVGSVQLEIKARPSPRRRGAPPRSPARARPSRRRRARRSFRCSCRWPKPCSRPRSSTMSS